MASTKHPLRICVAAACSLLVALPTPIDSARWWHSPRFVADLNLSAAQRSAIDKIFQAGLAKRLETTERARAAQARLDRLLETDADDSILEEAAMQVADTDAARQRLRTLMLYRMSRILSPQQRARLVALAQQRRRGRVP